MQPVRLSVNLNKVATVRNARGGDRPSVKEAARLALLGGADGITVHPRPDGRHIREADVEDLASWLPVELNIEGFPSETWLRLVERVRPAQATLVPDPPEVLTSNAGWDPKTADRVWLAEVVARLHAAGARVSVFVDPDPMACELGAAVGADRIELYTGPYAKAFPSSERQTVLERYCLAAKAACDLGLGVHAGHDLDCENLPTLVRVLPGLQEVSIGHALISDALLYWGIEEAVRRYRRAANGEDQETDGSCVFSRAMTDS